MAERQIIEADLTWLGAGSHGRLAAGVRVAVENGSIVEAGELREEPTVRLRGRALLPGFINAHSHAFQRGLRGLGETFPQGAGDFWSWREAMYRLVESLDQQSIYEHSRRAFQEMLDAGITTVGEFHYAHHDSSLAGYGLDEAVLRAARDAGIRMVLLQTFYKTGGVGQPLSGGQVRFRTSTVEEYWSQFERLSRQADHSTQSLGVAAHSVRAVPIEDIEALHEESIRRGLVFHMHVEEQPREIEECLAAYSRTPMRLVCERLAVNPRFTSVHCTHTAAADMDDYLDAGGNVCINPLTEGNLGDGVAKLGRVLSARGHIAIGSDSNARICWTEEMRWLEYGQRLATLSRGACRDDRGEVASKLLEFATVDGARSLGLKAGAIQPGRVADFTAVDLAAPSLGGWTPQTLLSSLIFGTGNDAIAGTCVAGRWRHRGEEPS